MEEYGISEQVVSYPFPKEAKGNKSTEVPPRNSKGPSRGIITMHEEGYFLRQQD